MSPIGSLELRRVVWNACATYFLRSDGAIPEDAGKLIRRILKSLKEPGGAGTALQRVSSDIMTVAMMLEEANSKFPDFPFPPEDAEAIFTFFREADTLH